MSFIIDNFNYIVPGLFIFLIAIFNGLRTGKIKKFIAAALNLCGLLLLLVALYFFLQKSFFNSSDAVVDQSSQTTTEYYNPQYLSTPNFNIQDTLFFDKVFVFLDFSGSVKAEELEKRLDAASKTVDKIPDRHFYYFGSCYGELSLSGGLSFEKIKQIQDHTCDNSYRVKSYTDIFSVLDYTGSLLAHVANDRTLVLFLTDDEQSAAKGENNFIASLEKIKSSLKVFKNTGVIFELIKIRGNTTNSVMSSATLQDIFNVDELKVGDFNSQMDDIFKERLIKDDLLPLSAYGTNSNQKVIFHYPDMALTKSGSQTINIEIDNRYKSFVPVIRIDSITGKTWKAIPKKTDVGVPYFGLTNKSKKIQLVVDLISHNKRQLVNKNEEDTVETFYTVFIPGSQQYNVQSYFKENEDFAASDLKSEAKGAYFASYFSSVKEKIIHKVSRPLLSVYAFILFILARVVAVSLSPSLKGRQISIKRKDVNNYSILKKIKRNQQQEIFKDLNGLEAFYIRANKIARNHFNIFSQPSDFILLSSPLLYLQNNNGELVDSIFISKNWSGNCSGYIFNIR